MDLDLVIIVLITSDLVAHDFRFRESILGEDHKA